MKRFSNQDETFENINSDIEVIRKHVKLDRSTSTGRIIPMAAKE